MSIVVLVDVVVAVDEVVSDISPPISMIVNETA